MFKNQLQAVEHCFQISKKYFKWSIVIGTHLSFECKTREIT